MIDKNAIPTKLLWVDLEMTGLDSRSDVILEVAAEVTDFDFKILGSYEAVITQPNDKLEAMNEWCMEQHAASGLLDRIKLEGKAEAQVRQELVDFIKTHFDEPVILAGNSIHNDRNFIKFWWPEIDELLHYRMLDVSSLKVLMQGKYDVKYEKKGAHRAFDDIHDCMTELKVYLEWFKKQSVDPSV